MKKISKSLGEVPKTLEILLNRLFETQENESERIFYLVGGCVRDRLMGFEPKDWDIVTNCNPMEILKILNTIFKDDIYDYNIFISSDDSRFGVIRVIFVDKKTNFRDEYEIVTFRGEGKYLDNRRPDSVYFSSIDVDANRRDFTMNALYYDPYNKVIIDFHGGLEDINRNILRGVGNPLKRFKEDKLRILRAYRFAIKYDMVIEPSLLTAINYLTEETKYLEGVSYERQLAELKKIAIYFPSYTKNQISVRKFLQDYVNQYKKDPNAFIQLPSKIQITNLNELMSVSMLFYYNHEEYLTHLKFSKTDIEEIKFFWLILRYGVTYDILSKFKNYIKNNDVDDIKLSLIKISPYTIKDINKELKAFDFVLENRTNKYMEMGYSGSELGMKLKEDANEQFNNFMNNG